ncbi:MAG: hypothetical protein OWU84_05705 [Firmicutes bacterium]|nr:hypothetical protein [Bacillota bacterium]
MGLRDAVAFPEQAVRLVREGHRSVASVARELGVPENPRHDGVHVLDKHPEQPFVGSGRLRPAEHAARDLERRIRDLEEENAILKSDAPRRQRPEVKFAFIHEHRSIFRITTRCQVLPVLRSGYYQWRRRTPLKSHKFLRPTTGAMAVPKSRRYCAKKGK